MTEPQRLSDRILISLEMAVQQKDAEISALLSRALELSLTRKTGGKSFVEQRSIEDRILKALDESKGLNAGKARPS